MLEQCTALQCQKMVDLKIVDVPEDELYKIYKL